MFQLVCELRSKIVDGRVILYGHLSDGRLVTVTKDKRTGDNNSQSWSLWIDQPRRAVETEEIGGEGEENNGEG